MPAPSAPMAVARVLLDERHLRNGRRTLVHHRGSFLEHVGPQWREVDDDAIRAWIYTRLEHEKYWKPPTARTEGEYLAWNPTTPKVNQVRDALAGVTELSGDVDPPAWIGEGAPPWSGTVLAARNRLVAVPGRTEHEHTPDLFNHVSVPFDYDPTGPEPARWLEFLGSLWPDDPDSIEALRQWFGYVLSGRTELHKILLLVGPPRSGKGTITRTLEALVGRGNTANPTLAGLGTNFGLAPLIGRPLAVIGDARLSGKVDGGPIVERLLSISGEDALTIDRKHQKAWTGRLPTRFVITSNELPRLGDASGAIARRFLTLTLEHHWRGREDTALATALDVELPGILRWALDGLDALGRGPLPEPASAADAVVALQELTSPTQAFIDECCVEGGQVPIPKVWEAWRRWAMNNGHPTGSSPTLTRNLRAAVPGLRTTQVTRDGKRVRDLVGLSLQPTTTGPWTAPVGPSPTPVGAAAGFMRGVG